MLSSTDISFILVLLGIGVGIAAFIPMILKYIRKKSIQEFMKIRRHRSKEQSKLDQLAIKYYKEQKDWKNIELLPNNILGSSGSLLSSVEWIPDKPIPINKIITDLDKQEFAKFEEETAKQGKHVQERCIWKKLIDQTNNFWPYRTNFKRYERYSDAIEAFDKPDLWHDEVPQFRLLKVKKENDQYKLTFSASWYFDHIDTEEPLVYEIAAFDLKNIRKNMKSMEKHLQYRKKLNPFIFENRCAPLGVNTLTIFKDAGQWQFVLHDRSKTGVAEGPGQFHIIPGAQFEKAYSLKILDIDNFYDKIKDDCDITRNIIREYGEEFLNEKINSPADWNKHPFKDLRQAIEEDKLKVYFLGLGINPINLRPEILTVCIFHEDTFRNIFRKIIKENPEGEIIWKYDEMTKKLESDPFDEENVSEFVNSNKISTPASAVLKLAWEFRSSLLS